MNLPRRLSVVFLRVRSLVFGRRLDRELDEELAYHVDRQIDQHVARGLTPEQARTAALRALGGVESRKEEMRDERGTHMIENLARDIRLALRQLRTQPAFATAAIVSLALGIGANTAIFQLLTAVSLRRLPVPAAHELVEIRLTGEGRAGRHTGRNRQLSLPQFQELQRRQQAFTSLMAFGDTRFNLSPQGEVRYVEGLWVSGTFFDTLGVTPAHGRLIGPDDDRPGCGAPGAVISYALWQREFGGRPDVTTMTVPFGDRRVPILGVTPPAFFGVEVGRRFDVALPTCSAGFNRRDHWWLAAIGRLKPGWTRAQALAHLQGLLPAVQQETLPSYRETPAKQYLSMRVDVVDASAGVSPLRRSYERPLWILMTIAALVLVIACVNLANLFLARAAARAEEFAIRLAIGGSRRRILQQVLVEAALVSTMGSTAALLVAVVASASIPPLISTTVDRVYLDLSASWWVFGFTALVAACATLVFGVGPSIKAVRATKLRTGSRGATASHGLRVRRALVASQIAITVVLLFSGLLFLRSFTHLATTDIGVGERGILVANLFLSERGYPVEKRPDMYRFIHERLGALPGLVSMAEAFTTPLGGSFWDTDVEIDGKERGRSNVNEVTRDYFDTLGTRLMAGRDFDDRDTPGATRVAIVNESFAAAFFSGSPVGRRFAMPISATGPRTPVQIVGLVADQKYLDVRERSPRILFLPRSHEIGPGLTRRYVIRSTEPPARTIAAVNAAVRAIDPNITIRYALLDTQIAESMLQERLLARLSGMFGLVALALAIVGLYGVVSYTVASRRSEIGVRVALGASRRRIVAMVLADVGRVLVAGVLAGSAGALLAARGIRPLLYGVEATDAPTLAAALVLLIAAGICAAAFPARRAAGIDPISTLRES